MAHTIHICIQINAYDTCVEPPSSSLAPAPPQAAPSQLGSQLRLAALAAGGLAVATWALAAAPGGGDDDADGDNTRIIMYSVYAMWIMFMIDLL